MVLASVTDASCSVLTNTTTLAHQGRRGGVHPITVWVESRPPNRVSSVRSVPLVPVLPPRRVWWLKAPVRSRGNTHHRSTSRALGTAKTPRLLTKSCKVLNYYWRCLC